MHTHTHAHTHTHTHTHSHTFFTKESSEVAEVATNVADCEEVPGISREMCYSWRRWSCQLSGVISGRVTRRTRYRISPKQDSFLLVPSFNEWTHLQYIFLSTFPLYNSGLCSFTYIVMLFNHALDPVSCACAVCCKG